MPKRNLQNIVADLKAQQEVFDRQLVEDMADLFEVPVDRVEDYKIEDQLETGILVSGSTRYRFRVDGAAGVKELANE